MYGATPPLTVIGRGVAPGFTNVSVSGVTVSGVARTVTPTATDEPFPERTENTHVPGATGVTVRVPGRPPVPDTSATPAQPVSMS